MARVLVVATSFIVLASGMSCVRDLNSAWPEKTCEVHGTRLQTDIVPLEYGRYYSGTESYKAARKAQFPHAVRLVSGGCTDGPDWAIVRNCERCNKAEEEWMQQQGERKEVTQSPSHAGGGP